MKILIADDNEASRRIIAALIQSALGHECHIVNDGADAWDTFLMLRPDVVISDWLMPGLSGVELCQRIRSDPVGGHTYFIMVTGQGHLDQILEGMNAGADDYLVKPLNPDDLRLRLVAAARIAAFHGELGRERSELEGRNDELTAIARRDPLTGLGNRRALDEDLAMLDARVTRYGHRYCMALVDVDFFKAYNEAYGHPGGDRVLHEVAVVLSDQVRAGDGVYRYGGDEFLCIFAEQSLETGTLAVERMRGALDRLAIVHVGNPLGVLTISAGMALLDSRHARPVGEVLKEADEALYRAKGQGRNRVGQPISPSPDSR